MGRWNALLRTGRYSIAVPLYLYMSNGAFETESGGFPLCDFKDPAKASRLPGTLGWLLLIEWRLFFVWGGRHRLYTIYIEKAAQLGCFFYVYVCPYLGDFFPELWEARGLIAAMFEFHADGC